MPKRTKASHGPHPVDVHVGARLRLRRTILGMSQTKLGTALGLTFQQVQKYERGQNRMGASRLYECAKILDMPVSFFFDDMPKDLRQEMAPAPEVAYHGHRADRASLELMRYFPKLPAGIRGAILTIARESAASEEDTGLVGDAGCDAIRDAMDRAN